MMEINICKSLNPDDYEILIRKRGEKEYASYCPQLNQILKGTEHEQVRLMMKEFIEKHIKSLKQDTQFSVN